MELKHVATENKRNGPILIENFEPTACAGKSAQKVETRTRVSAGHTHKQRHRALCHSSGQAGEAARHGGQAHVRFAQFKQKVVLWSTDPV